MLFAEVLLYWKAMCLHIFNSKNSGPVLLFKTIFRHENCFLSSVTTDGKDEHELRFEKVWQTVLSFNAMLAETHL